MSQRHRHTLGRIAPASPEMFDLALNSNPYTPHRECKSSVNIPVLAREILLQSNCARLAGQLP